MPSDYSANELLSMQQDAIRRVREMQRRANVHLNPPPDAHPEPQTQTQAPPEPTTGGKLETGAREAYDDRAMILLLCILLAREGADQKLILAMLYLLL